MAVLFATEAHYCGTVKGPDSKAGLEGVSALPRERLIHPHRACSVSRNPGSGQWLSPCYGKHRPWKDEQLCALQLRRDL